MIIEERFELLLLLLCLLIDILLELLILLLLVIHLRRILLDHFRNQPQVLLLFLL